MSEAGDAGERLVLGLRNAGRLMAKASAIAEMIEGARAEGVSDLRLAYRILNLLGHAPTREPAEGRPAPLARPLVE